MSKLVTYQVTNPLTPSTT